MMIEATIAQLLCGVLHSLIDKMGLAYSVRESIGEHKVGLNMSKCQTNHVLNVLMLLLER